MKKNTLKIMFLAAEADPFIKIGGLGDIAGTLPQKIRELSSQSNIHPATDIRLVIPFHGAIQRHAFSFHQVGTFTVQHHDGPITGEALQTNLDGLPVYLISGAPIEKDAPVYCEDTAVDGHKFTFFSLAALELAKLLDWKPDVLHANDWHTAIAIYALKTRKDPFFKNTSTLLGLHNLPFMGENAGVAIERFGLAPTDDPFIPWWANHMPLPLGLLTADHIVAVSPAYAKEILTHDYGAGLEDFLRHHERKISGIMNGIDTNLWNPETDPNITANFSKEALSKRAKNKSALIKEFNLNPDPNIPLLAIVTRLDPQKGIDLLPVALHLLEQERWQVIILGTGTPELENAMRKLETDYPNRLRAAIRFDALLSHRIYAGADMLLIPSRYEPCGLTQMIAMRYGCVPVARSTGGLKDTIHDHNVKKRTGFLFPRANSKDFASGIRRALTAYDKKEIWKELQYNGMSQDFSWEASAKKYLKLYQSLKPEKVSSHKG